MPENSQPGYLNDVAPFAWNESDKQTAALATATRAANAKGFHVPVSIHASYDDPAISGLLQLKDGATVIWEGHVHGSRDVTLPRGLKCAVNQALSAELAAGAAGKIGIVEITGLTVQGHAFTQP